MAEDTFSALEQSGIVYTSAGFFDLRKLPWMVCEPQLDEFDVGMAIARMHYKLPTWDKLMAMYGGTHGMV